MPCSIKIFPDLKFLEFLFYKQFFHDHKLWLYWLSVYQWMSIITSLAVNFSVDTGRKLNVHKSFRRRPRRLLNVLCTLDLRPVSTGLKTVLEKSMYVFLRYATNTALTHTNFLKSVSFHISGTLYSGGIYPWNLLFS